MLGLSAKRAVTHQRFSSLQDTPDFTTMVLLVYCQPAHAPGIRTLRNSGAGSQRSNFAQPWIQLQRREPTLKLDGAL